jgi:hypothetical protein
MHFASTAEFNSKLAGWTSVPDVKYVTVRQPPAKGGENVHQKFHMDIFTSASQNIEIGVIYTDIVTTGKTAKDPFSLDMVGFIRAPRIGVLSTKGVLVHKDSTEDKIILTTGVELPLVKVDQSLALKQDLSLLELQLQKLMTSNKPEVEEILKKLGLLV